MTLISHFKTNYLGRKYEALSMMSFYLIMTKNDRRCENPFLLFPFTRNMGVVTSLVAMVSLSRIKPDDVTKLFEPRLFFFSLLSQLQCLLAWTVLCSFTQYRKKPDTWGLVPNILEKGVRRGGGNKSVTPPLFAPNPSHLYSPNID